MRDKNNHRQYDADNHEAEMFEGMQRENSDAMLAVQWSTIPDQKPAKRPNSDDEKALAFLKKRNLMPSDAQLADLQRMLDDIEGDAHKKARADMLAELQKLPTTKDVHDSYQWLAYQLTFHDEKQDPSLFQYHQQLINK